jgi:hypothetical protein
MLKRTPTRIRRRSGARGITTAEMIAGVSLGLILAASLYTFQQTQTKAFRAQTVYSDSQNVTRTAIDLMTRDLRMASYDPTGPGAGGALTASPGPSCPGVDQGIVSATPTSVRFQQDLNGDGAINAATPGEDVTYDISGGDLRRTDGGSGAIALVSGLPSNGLAFSYFDGSNPPVQLVPSGTPPALTQGQRACVAKIRMVVTANLANPRAARPITSTAGAEVAIRSRSLNNF